jgi:hypothetical protein
MQRKIIYGIICFVVVGIVSWALLINYNPALNDNIHIMGALVFAIIGGIFGLALGSKLNKTIGDRETIETLKLWFIVAGLLSLVSALQISDNGVNLLFGFQEIVQIVLGLITLYIGLDFKNLIRNSSKFIIYFLYAEIAYSILMAIISLTYKTEGSSSINFGLIGGILIQAYLISTINRLAKR